MQTATEPGTKVENEGNLNNLEEVTENLAAQVNDMTPWGMRLWALIKEVGSESAMHGVAQEVTVIYQRLLYADGCADQKLKEELKKGLKEEAGYDLLALASEVKDKPDARAFGRKVHALAGYFAKQDRTQWEMFPSPNTYVKDGVAYLEKHLHFD